MARMKPTTSWAPWPTKSAAVAGVLEQGADGFHLGIAELDPEDHLRVETGDEVRQRGVRPEDVPEVHDQPGGGVTGRPDQVGALRHGADEGEGKWLERDAGSDGRCFVGDAAKRFDEGCDVVHRGSELGPDLDERRPELARCLEQELPGPTPSEVVVAPPAGGELDLHVPKAGALDLGPESGEADRLRTTCRSPWAKPMPAQPVDPTARTRSIAANGLTSGSSSGATLPALVQQVATSAGAFMRSGRRRPRHPRRPNGRRRRRGRGRRGHLRSLGWCWAGRGRPRRRRRAQGGRPRRSARGRTCGTGRLPSTESAP